MDTSAEAIPDERQRLDYVAIAKEIDLEEIALQVTRLGGVLRLARQSVLAPDEVKKPPTFSSKQLQRLVGIDQAQYVYRRRNPGTLPVGTTLPRGNTTVFTVEELRQWSQHYRKSYLKPEGAPATVITVANFKGGSTKTTTTLALAQSLTMRGHTVLVIDADPQASLTLLCDAMPDAKMTADNTLLSVFTNHIADASELIRPTYWPGLDMIGSTPTLSAADIFGMRRIGEEDRPPMRSLDDALQVVRSAYDVVLIDTAPSLTYTTVNAMLAADGVIMPLSPAALDFHSSALFWQLFQQIASDATLCGKRKSFKFIRVLLSKVRFSAPQNAVQTSRIVEQWIHAGYAEKVLPVRIPDLETIRSAAKDLGTPMDSIGRDAQTDASRRALAAYDELADQVEHLINDCWKDALGQVRRAEA